MFGSDRLELWPMIRAHGRSLKNRSLQPDQYNEVRVRESVDKPAVAASLLIPTVAAVLAAVYVTPTTDFAGATLAGAALLVGGMFAAFAQLAAWRTRLTDRMGDYQVAEVGFRDLIDEAVNHVVLACVESALLLIASTVVMALSAHGLVAVVAAVVSVALLAHLVFLFIVITRAMYGAYVEANKVADRLNGFARTRA